MYIEKLKEMFEKMVLQKNASLIPVYYHQDFVLYENGEKMTYEEYLNFHQDVYATSIRYDVAYDEETFLEQGEKVAGRLWVTTQLPSETPKKIEVVFIALFKESKIYRLWELPYPDWSKMPEFQ